MLESFQTMLWNDHSILFVTKSGPPSVVHLPVVHFRYIVVNYCVTITVTKLIDESVWMFYIRKDLKNNRC